jgi:hypothetical protein
MNGNVGPIPSPHLSPTPRKMRMAAGVCVVHMKVPSFRQLLILTQEQLS